MPNSEYLNLLVCTILIPAELTTHLLTHAGAQTHFELKQDGNDGCLKSRKVLICFKNICSQHLSSAITAIFWGLSSKENYKLTCLSFASLRD